MSISSELSVTFNQFHPDRQYLILEGDAAIINNELQLTRGETGGEGKALYFAPVQLWLNSSAFFSFETIFTLQMSAYGNDLPGNKLAFFIASSGNDPGEIVSVLFDIQAHDVEIDIKSVPKVAKKWNLPSGQKGTARIRYDSVGRKLSVICYYPQSDPVSLSWDDKSEEFQLPHEVRVGFCGTSGKIKQQNSILSWSFSLKSVEKE